MAMKDMITRMIICTARMGREGVRIIRTLLS
jgi:hypothetical protein